MVAVSVARKVLPWDHLHSELGASENSDVATKILPTTALAGYSVAPGLKYSLCLLLTVRLV